MKSVHALDASRFWNGSTSCTLRGHHSSQIFSGSSINVQAGENLTYQFYTSRYTAGSYNITGLPNGLSYDGSNTITGTLSEAGSYTVKITGYRGEIKVVPQHLPFLLI